jgi:hypothetical protein
VKVGYKGLTLKFFYANKRTGDGGSKGSNIDRPVYAEFYSLLVDHKGNEPWRATFAKDKRYVKF